MKKISFGSLLIVIMLAGCTASPSELPPRETSVPLDQLVAEAVAKTQTAKEKIPPSLPYSPHELAVLMDPGEDLKGEWHPSTVYDLTQPYPPAEYCGYIYNGCSANFANNIATHGAELTLLHQGYQLGEVALLYYEDLSLPETLFLHVQNNWSDTVSDDDLWMNSYNPYQRDGLGENWMHKAGYSLFYWEGPEADTTYYRPEREFNYIEIRFIRCHMYVELDFRFPVENPWDSPDDNLDARAAEQQANFDLVYDYAQSLDERITPYACNP